MQLTALQVIAAAGVVAVIVVVGVLHWLLGQLVVGYAQMEAAERLDELAPSPDIVEKSASGALGLSASSSPIGGRR